MHVDCPRNRLVQIILGNAAWVILTRVVWQYISWRLWIIWRNSDGTVLEANLEGLIFSVVIVKDDFSAVGGIAHQYVAKILVGLNILGSSVARLSIRLAAQRRGLQGLASGLVNVGYGCLLGVWSVSYDFLDVGVIVSNVLVRNILLVSRVALNCWSCNVFEVLCVAPNSLDHLPSYLVNRCSSFVVQAVVYACRSSLLTVGDHVGNVALYVMGKG